MTIDVGDAIWISVVKGGEVYVACHRCDEKIPPEKWEVETTEDAVVATSCCSGCGKDHKVKVRDS